MPTAPDSAALHSTGGCHARADERDLLDRLAGEDLDLDALHVRTVMAGNPQALTEDDALVYAVHRMAVGHYRQIPVVRNNRPVGFVTVRGVLKFLAQNAG